QVRGQTQGQKSNWNKTLESEAHLQAPAAKAEVCLAVGLALGDPAPLPGWTSQSDDQGTHLARGRNPAKGNEYEDCPPSPRPDRAEAQSALHSSLAKCRIQLAYQVVAQD